MQSLLIIGDRINSSSKTLAKAIRERNAFLVQEEARIQEEAGAHYLDVNAGKFVGEEAEHLTWLIEVVQGATQLPLCIDSPDPEVMRRVLPLARRRPIVNSLTLESGRMEGMLPLVVENRTKVVALCQDGREVATTAEAKLRMSEKIVEKLTKAGVPMEDIFIDPLLVPLAIDFRSAVETLRAIEKIRRSFPEVHVTCGLRNVSHGLPRRELVHRTFIVAAIAVGLDSAILDPCEKGLMAAIKAAELVQGRDDFCLSYIEAFRKGQLVE